MRLRFWQPITLQQDLYATISDLLGGYESKGKLKGKDKAAFIIRWSEIIKNVIYLHLDRGS